MEIGNSSPIQTSASESHGNHDAVAIQRGGGSSFSAELTQAISALPGGAASNAYGAPHAGGHNSSASNLNGFAQPASLPISGANAPSKHGFQEAALAVRAYRQQLIAANIANADTPNYKAVDKGSRTFRADFGVFAQNTTKLWRYEPFLASN